MSKKAKFSEKHSDPVIEARRSIPALAVKHQIIDAEVCSDPPIASRIREIIDALPDRVAVQVADTLGTERNVPTRHLAEIVERFGISGAERLLLEALIDGDSVTRHAEKTGTSVNTARTHMRRLLEKTGSSNQVDLVRKVFTGGA